jgi:hypothetical protein
MKEYRGKLVIQDYGAPGVVKGYRCTTVARMCRSTGDVQLYNGYSSTMVQGYRSSISVALVNRLSTVVLGFCVGSRVVQGYTGTGLLQGYTGTGVVQVYWSKRELQVSRSGRGLQENYRGSRVVEV